MAVQNYQVRMAELDDNQLTLAWNLGLHCNLCYQMISTLCDWLYDHTIREDSHPPSHYHATMHVETEGAHRGAIWAEWHCGHCLIIY